MKRSWVPGGARLFSKMAQHKAFSVATDAVRVRRNPVEVGDERSDVLVQFVEREAGDVAWPRAIHRCAISTAPSTFALSRGLCELRKIFGGTNGPVTVAAYSGYNVVARCRNDNAPP